jgi:geranylgeranyl transferase type-2 subunit alpha
MLTPIELALIHSALFDPYDQSLWFYHQYLMSSFDPDLAIQTMAPNLTNDERLEYIEREVEFIKDILEDVEDCKWIYQSLVECQLLTAKINGQMSEKDRNDVRGWLSRLKELDQLRYGRWVDLERKL